MYLAICHAVLLHESRLLAACVPRADQINPWVVEKLGGEPGKVEEAEKDIEDGPLESIMPRRYIL